MEGEVNEKTDPANDITNQSAQDVDVTTVEKEVVLGIEEVEKVLETLGNDVVGESEGIHDDAISPINEDDILPTNEDAELPTNEDSVVPSSDKVDADLMETVPDTENVAGYEVRTEEAEHSDVKTGEDEQNEVKLEESENIEPKSVEVEGDDGMVETKQDENIGDQELPTLDAIGVDAADETAIPITTRTEEELISSIELNQVRVDVDGEGEVETAEDHRAPSEPGSDHSDEQLKSLAPSDKMKGSKESLGSNPLAEDVEVESDELSEDLSDKYSQQRIELVEQCRSLLLERKQLRRKNILFHKKLHDYFKKKKAEGTYHEGDSSIVGSGSAELHYRKKLLVFDDIQSQVANESVKIENESKELIERRNSLQEEALLELESLLKQEETLGHGLINSQTGKVLSDKVTLQLVNRQGQIAKQLSEAMLKYIKVRDKVNETETDLKSLEVLGEGLHLIDYEQLRVENRSLHDKIEERDNELSRLREKIETAIITMTHMDEKAFGTNHLVNESNKELKTLMSKLRESREKRTKAQKRLIHTRSEIERLYHEAGLLAHHPLLRDFELVLKQVEQLEIEVNQMKKHVLQGEKVTPQSNKIYPGGPHRKESATSLSQENNHKKRTISKDSLSKKGSDKQKPQLMKGWPSVMKFLLRPEE